MTTAASLADHIAVHEELFAHYDALDESRRGTTLFVEPIDAVFNSLRFGAGATVIALVVGVLAAVAIARGHGRLARSLDTSLMLPLGTSAATVGFGVRNMADLDQGLREIGRVLRPGGRLLVLEFALPRVALVRRAYLAYFRHVLPRIDRWALGCHDVRLIEQRDQRRKRQGHEHERPVQQRQRHDGHAEQGEDADREGQWREHVGGHIDVAVGMGLLRSVG